MHFHFIANWVESQENYSDREAYGYGKSDYEHQQPVNIIIKLVSLIIPGQDKSYLDPKVNRKQQVQPDVHEFIMPRQDQ